VTGQGVGGVRGFWGRGRSRREGESDETGNRRRGTVVDAVVGGVVCVCGCVGRGRVGIVFIFFSWVNKKIFTNRILKSLLFVPLVHGPCPNEDLCDFHGVVEDGPVEWRSPLIICRVHVSPRGNEGFRGFRTALQVFRHSFRV
jgi:hypothetical protein